MFFVLENIQAADNFDVFHINNGNLDDSERYSSMRLSCFAHTIQLCVRDGLKNIPHISKVFEKCQKIAKFSSQSSKIADLLEELDVRISKMNITRWNSEYMLMRSILSIERNDLESITKLMDNTVTFLNNDLVILREIIDVLEPFYEISIKCQSDTIVTVSLVVPAIVHIITHLRDIGTSISICTKLVEQLQSSIEKRFPGIIHRLNLVDVDKHEAFNDPLYFIATVLDPSFKFYWISDMKLPANLENRLKQNIIQLILDEISSYTDPSSSSSPLPTKVLPIDCASNPLKTKKRKMFAYHENNIDASDTMTYNPMYELQSYLNDPLRSRFSDYWANSRFHNLKKLVVRIFSVQASSAPVERVFSHAGLILSARRTNMSEQLFRDLVLLKVNQSLL